MASTNNMLQPRLQKFTGKSYNQWSIRMKVLYNVQDLWVIVEIGFVEPENQTDFTQQQQLIKLKENRKKDKKTLFFILQAVDEEIFERISSATTTKQACVTLYTSYKGEEKNISQNQVNEGIDTNKGQMDDN